MDSRKRSCYRPVISRDDLEGNLSSRPGSRPSSAVSRTRKRQRPKSAVVRRNGKQEMGIPGIPKHNLGYRKRNSNKHITEHLENDERGLVLEFEKAVSRLSSLPSSASAIRVLRTLRDAYEAFQLQGEDMHIHALECLNHAYCIKEQLLGSTNKWTKATRTDYVKCCNIVGTQLLRKGCPELGSKVLYKALSIKTDIQSKEATLVNLSVCHFSQGFYEDSLKYLLATLKSKKKGPKWIKPVFEGETYLNLSTCYYYLGNMSQALLYSQRAVHACQERAREALQRPKYCMKTIGLSDDPMKQKLYTPKLSTRKQQLQWKSVYRAAAESLRKGEIEEALVCLSLSYLALGKALLRSTEYERCIDQGLKWHRKAFSEVAEKHTLFPKKLRRTLWIVYVQTCFRFYRFRASPQDRDIFLARRHAGAMWMQRVFRSYCKRKQVSIKIVSTLLLQRTIRRFLQYRRQIKTNAIIQIQSWMRQVQAQYIYFQQHDAALSLQSQFRGFRIRQKYDERKREANMAASLIQLHYKKKIEWNKQKLEEERLYRQQHVLRSIANHWLSKTRARIRKQNEGAVALQAAFRGKAARQQYNKVNDSCLIVQSNFRMFRDRKNVQCLHRVSAGTHILNSIINKYLKRNALVNFQIFLESTAVKVRKTNIADRRVHFIKHKVLMQWINIDTVRLDSAFSQWKKTNDFLVQQNTSRSMRSMAREKELKESRSSSGSTPDSDGDEGPGIVSSAVGTVGSFEAKAAHKDAAVVLQNAFRKKQDHQFRKRNEAATRIQSKYRGSRTRKVKMQKSYRKKRDHELTKRNEAATRIQAKFRGSRTRRTIKDAEDCFDASVLMIQKLYRGHKVRKSTKEGNSTAVANPDIDSSVVRIQKTYRGRRVRRDLKEQKQARIIEDAKKFRGKTSSSNFKSSNKGVGAREKKIVKERSALRSMRTSVIKT